MMNLKEIYNIYKFLGLKQVGPVFVNKLLRNFSTASTLHLETPEEFFDSELFKNSLSKTQLDEYQQSDIALENSISKLLDEGCQFTTIISPNYPQRLLRGLENNAPTILSYRGNCKLFENKCVGFCGARKASERGLSVAEDCVLQLSENGVTIVSGNASGVDQRTHHAALQNGGTTVLVIPEGLANFQIKSSLEEVWDWERCLVISEFSPTAPWSAGRAMQRNATIIGLSVVMILIEAAKKGGSMDAGNKTLKMERKLFAPVYDGMPDFAIGNAILLEQGAIPLWKNNSTGRANISKILSVLIDDTCSQAQKPNQPSLFCPNSNS